MDIRDTKRVYSFLSILYPFIKHGEVKLVNDTGAGGAPGRVGDVHVVQGC